MSASGALFWWLPALLVGALSVLALAVAWMPATKTGTRRSRLLAAIAVFGSAALAVSVWQGSAASNEIARLQQNDRTEQLALQVKSLEQELTKLKEATRARSLGEQTAAKLADYLRPYGSRKIVVSCVPNDVEAYRYATEIANTLKDAGWDASGPETTAIFGNIRAMAINIYDPGSAGPDTAKILVDAFAKFGIPYQSRVPPAELVDGSRVELFVGAKPVPPALATTEPAH